MPEPTPDWEDRYAHGNTPWDSGAPSDELRRILDEGLVKPTRTLELGCGTGTNAVFLAGRGFEVTAIDISRLAIEQAEKKARDAGVDVRFLATDLAELPDLGPPFPFVFDRGLYHVVRRTNLQGFLAALRRLTQPGGMYLTLAGNANEREEIDDGPPQVKAEEVCAELLPIFELVQMREFRFDGVTIDGKPVRPLAWSILLRRPVDRSG